MSGKTGLDLNHPQDNLLTFIKTRVSLEPEEIVFWWVDSGKILQRWQNPFTG